MFRPIEVKRRKHVIMKIIYAKFIQLQAWSYHCHMSKIIFGDGYASKVVVGLYVTEFIV